MWYPPPGGGGGSREMSRTAKLTTVVHFSIKKFGLVDRCYTYLLSPEAWIPPAGLERPVPVLHGADVPAARRPVELQLERLVRRDLILVSCHIHTWKQ